MSVNVTITAPLVTKAAKLDSTDPTEVYLAGSNDVSVIGLNIANTAGTAQTVLVEMVRDTIGYAIMPTVSIPANDAFEGPSFPIPLRTGDSIRMTAATADVIDVVLVAMEGAGAVR